MLRKLINVSKIAIVSLSILFLGFCSFAEAGNFKVIDDDGYAGMIGTYSGGGASDPTYTMDKTGVTPAPPNNYFSVAEINFTYTQGGWQGFYIYGDGVDVSSDDYLSFYVYSSQCNTEFEIGVKSSGGSQSTVDITDYLPNGANTSWQKVDIPLSDFSGVTWTNLTEYLSINNPNKSATVRICQAFYTKQSATKLRVNVPDNTVGVGTEQRIFIEAVDNSNNIDFTWIGDVELNTTGSASFSHSNPLHMTNGRFAVEITDDVIETVTVDADFDDGCDPINDSDPVNIEFVAPANVRIIDDDGYAGWVSTYSGGGASDPTYTMEKTEFTPELPNNYLSCAEIVYVYVQGGWQVWSLHGSALDVSEADYLSFYVYSSASNTEFEIGVKSSGGSQSTVDIADYITGGVGTSWEKVDIPLSDFSGVNWANLIEYLNINNPNKSATVRVAQVFYTKQGATKLEIEIQDTTVGVGMEQSMVIKAVDNNGTIDYTWSGTVDLSQTGDATFEDSSPITIDNGRYTLTISDDTIESVTVNAEYDSGSPQINDAESVVINFIAPMNTGIIDDYFSDTWMEASYRGIPGAYGGGGVGAPTYTMEKKGVTPAPPNNFNNVAEINFTYVQGGWQVWNLYGDTLDVSTSDYLTFYVYSSESNTEFEIGVKSFGGEQSKVDITNYLANGANTTWQKVDIPLSDFSGVTWWNLVEYFSIINTNKTATIRVCQVYYTKEGATELEIEIPDTTVGVGGIKQRLLIKAIDEYGNIDFTWSGTVDISATGNAIFGDDSPITLTNGRYATTIEDNTIETVTLDAEYDSGTPALTDADSVEVEFIPTENIALADDYIEGTWQNNGYIGYASVYSGGDSSDPTYTMDKTGVTPAPPNNYEKVAEINFTYSANGWQTWNLHGDFDTESETIDVSVCNYLSFYVYSSEANTEFSIGIKDWEDRAEVGNTVPITDYLSNGANTTWQKVDIPLADFGVVDLSKLIEYISIRDVNKTTTLRFCQIFYTKKGATTLDIEVPDDTVGVGMPQVIYVKAVDDYGNIDFTWQGTVNLTEDGDAVFGDSNPIAFTNGRFAVDISDDTIEDINVGADYVSGTPTLDDAAGVVIHFVSPVSVLIIDDYFEDTWKNAGYRGIVGTYAGDGASDPTFTMDKTGVTPAPPNNFTHVAEIAFTYVEGGWQTWNLHGGEYDDINDCIDVSTADYLTFYVWASVSNTTFDVGVKDWRGKTGTGSTVPITNYLANGANTTWQKVDIPLADFGDVDWSHLIEYFSIRDPNQTATVRICQVAYTKAGATKLNVNIPYDITTENIAQVVYIEAVDDYGNIDFTWSGTVNVSASGSATLSESNPISLSNGRYALEIDDSVAESVNVGATYVSGSPTLDDSQTSSIVFIDDASGDSFEIVDRELFINGSQDPHLIKGIDFEVTPIGNGPTERAWFRMSKDAPNKAWVDANENGVQDEGEDAVGDFYLMQQMGINTIRMYSLIDYVGPDYDDFNEADPVAVYYLDDAYENYGIKILAGHMLGMYDVVNEGKSWEDDEFRQEIHDEVMAMVNAYKDQPFILAWVLGNEPNWVIRNNEPAARALYGLVQWITEDIHDADTKHPVVLCNGWFEYADIISGSTTDPGTIDANGGCMNIDIYGWNSYSGMSYQYDINELHEKFPTKPGIITELGCDAWKHDPEVGNEGAEDQASQARFLSAQWNNMLANMLGNGKQNILGVSFFEYMDEWWKSEDPGYSGQSLSPWTHDTPGGWYNGTYSYDPGNQANPDKFYPIEWGLYCNFDEEHWGVFAQGNDGGDIALSPHIRRKRQAYDALKQLWNPSDPGANFALNETISASSELTGHEATKANDGNSQTDWQSQATDLEWLEIDLGEYLSVNQIVLDWAKRPREYQILAYLPSEDLAEMKQGIWNWQEVYSTSVGKFDNSGTDNIVVYGMPRVKEIKINCTERGWDSGFALSEFELYFDEDGLISNYALNRPAAVSLESADAEGEKAVDRFKWSDWWANSTDPQWIKIDLGDTRTINNIYIDWKRSASEYEIEVSEDDQNWTTVYTTDIGNGDEDSIVFPAQSDVQYVKISCNSASDPEGYSIRDLKICNDPNAEISNLSYGKSATASSQLTGYEASKAIDGDTSTRWESNSTDDEWIYVDLGEERVINTVVLDWEYYARGYKIQVSTNGADWTDVYATYTIGQAGIDSIVFSEISARYMRILGIERGSSSDGYSLKEIEVYYDPEARVSNYALDATATASSQLTGYEASKAIDGDLETKWTSDNSDPQNITLDLGTGLKINKVILDWDSFANSYVVEISSDNIDWTEVYWTNVGNGETDTIVFPAEENIRYVRINGEERGVPYGYSLKEIGIYYEKNGKISNLAYDKDATASSGSTGYEATKAIDADISTRWGSDFSDTEWIYVDLGETTTFNVVELRWENAYGSAYKIQVSANASDWTDVYYTTIGSGDKESIVFPEEDARYVRMQGIVGATSWGYSLWEFGIFYDSTIDLSNLALNKTATASSGSGDYGPDKAVDGDTSNTRWGSDYSDPQWIYVDLGEIRPVNKVILNWEGAYGKTYVVELSTDASNWTEVYSSEGYGQPGENIIFFPTDYARYVRMYGTERGTGWGYSLWEFEIYYDPIASLRNLSIDKDAFASSYEGDLTADKAIDTDLTTRWGSGFSDNQWITVDLGYPQFVNRVVLRWEAGYGRDYKIQLSNDGNNWTDVYSITDNENCQVDDISFTEENARYIRMNGTKRGTGWGYSLFEFETYYDQRVKLDNLALDKVTSASSVSNDNEAYNATDGSLRTVWESDSEEEDPQWIKVDLGESMAVNKVKLYWGTNYAESYAIEVSTDDNNWTEVYSTSTTKGPGIDYVVFSNQTIRYVRIYLLESGTEAGYSLWDFGVYYDTTAELSNLALDKTADTSSSETGHEASKAVDGTLATSWSTTGTGAEWLSVDLGAVKNVNKITVRWGTDYARAYTIQLSTDGETWIDVYSSVSGHSGIEEIVFPDNVARYVRIYVTDSGTSNGYEIEEFEVYYDTNAQISNLAYGKTATASSTSYGSTSNVTDGDMESRWSSNWWSPEWIYVDLDSSQKVNKTVVRWESAFGKDYIIQVSNDASSWQDVHFECEGNGSADSVVFPEETARYVRMYGIQRASGYGYSIYEFEVYYDPDAPVSDMAQDKDVVASSVEETGYEASKVVDGDPNTRWSSEHNDDEWIYVDLGETKLFNNVLFKWENAYAKSYKVQVSDNASDWTDVYVTTTGSGINERIVFPDESARYVRMLGLERAASYGGYSIWEFGVYYDPSLEPIVNLAYNQTVSASSEITGYEASKAVDGSLPTEWESSATDNEWIKVDFGENKNFNKFIFHWGSNYAKSYNIKISSDDENWKDIYSTTTSGGGADVIALTLKNARYIKVGCTERESSSEGFQLKEVEVYNDPNAALSNLAIWKSVSVSSEGAAWGYGAGLAVDNDFDTRWGSDYNDEEWFTVHLGESMTINKIVLRWFGENYGEEYEVKITEDYETWTTIYETTTGDGGDDVIVIPPVTASAVKMEGHKQGGGVGYSLKEFEIYYDPDIPDTNLARNKTTHASSELSGYESSNAVDGFRPSMWSSDANDAEWIYVDLGGIYLVNRVVLEWGSDYGEAYEIEASTDAENWVMVYDTTSGNGGIDTITFSTRLAKYIKMKGIESGTANGYSLIELEVYYDPEGGAQNLALEQATDASSELTVGRESEKAVDGNTATSWASDATNTEWLEVDIGDYRTINKVVIKWDSDYGETYKIEISSDGVEWTEVYSTSSGDGGIDTITFSAAQARYVRMYGTESGTGGGYSIQEFEVYYDSSGLGISSRVTLHLSGTWELEPGEETTKPSSYNYTVSVPSLVDTATPTLSWQSEDYFWYKVTFPLSSELAGAQHAFIKIDQSKYGTQVWLNNTNLGEYNGNYTSHEYDATSAIDYNDENTLLVRVGAKGTLPEGSVTGTDWEKYSWVPGIWGDVSLILTDKVKINNVQVIPDIDTDTAEVNVTLKNLEGSAQNVTLYLQAYEKSSGSSASNEISDSYTLSADEERIVNLDVPISNVTLWSPDNPFLYKLISRVEQGGEEIDRESTVFGMREFEIVSGDFYLNGDRVVLKGSNLAFHRFLADPNRGNLPWNENWIKSVLVDIPKENNMNFFRAHLGHMYNKWYDIADENGIMIQDEWMFWTWVIGSQANISAELKQWLRDNWNHPSIVVWDVVNEPGWGTGAQEMVEWLLNTLVPELKDMDSTRPYEQVDFIEMHPYLYSYQPVLGPDGYMDDMLEDQPRAFNEDIWFWFDKNGEPTFLTVPVLPRWLGANSSVDERYAFQAFLGSEIVELWRRKEVDQIAPFQYFGDDGGATSNWFLGDYEDLETKPIVSVFKDAFAPFGVSIEVWDRHFLEDEEYTIDVYVFNDYNTAKSGTLYCKIVDGEDATVVNVGSYNITSLSAGSKVIQEVDWTMPDTAGTYYLKAYLVPDGEQDPVATSKKVAHVFEAVTAPGNLTNAKIMVYDPDDEIYDYLSSQELGLNYVSTFDSQQLSSQDILILGEGALKDANYSSSIAAITDFVEAGHSVIFIEPAYNCSGTSTEELQLLDELSMDVMGASYRGNESYVFQDDENHPVWANIDEAHLKMFNGGWGGEAVSPYDVEVHERVVPQARCGKDLAIPALAETVWGDGVLVFSRIQVRGRLTEESDPGTDLYSRRVDPVSQELLLDSVSTYLDTATRWEEITDDLRNLPLYPNRAVSQSVKSNNDDYDSSKAVDMDMNTRWESEWSEPQWITIDLGKAKQINKVKLDWETAYAESYKIQISTDGVNWTTVYETTSGDGWTDNISFDPVYARYVRLYATERALPDVGFSLYEFGAYDDVDNDLGIVKFDETSYTGTTEEAVITLVDSDLNTDSYSQQTVNVEVYSTKDPTGITMTLTEINNDSDTFTSQETGKNLGFSEEASDDNDEVIHVSEGSIVTVSYDDASPEGTQTVAVLWYSGRNSANLALNKTATASSQESGDNSAAKAVDGDVFTRWSSTSGSDPQWIYVDLEEITTFNKVVLDWEGAYAISYKIQMSDNASDWTDIYSTTTGDGYIDEITFSPVQARYVRMYGTERGTDYGYSLWEFGIYYTVPNSANFALYRETEASSEDTGADGEKEHAVDGNPSTRWASNWSDPQWITVDLGYERSINKVVLSWEDAYAESYKIQVSTDNQNWDDAYSTTTGDGDIDAIYFTTTTARYVRMYGTERGTGWGYSLWEFEVYYVIQATSATASSNQGSGYEAGKAIDGDYSTRWASDDEDDEWIYIDLGSTTTFDTVLLTWESAFASEYSIQISDNATNWTTVYTTSAGSGGTEAIVLDTQSARYVKMLGIQRATQWGYSLWEMEVSY